VATCSLGGAAVNLADIDGVAGRRARCGRPTAELDSDSKIGGVVNQGPAMLDCVEATKAAGARSFNGVADTSGRGLPRVVAVQPRPVPHSPMGALCAGEGAAPCNTFGV